MTFVAWSLSAGMILGPARWSVLTISLLNHVLMKLLIPRISDATTRKDMVGFVNGVLKNWFRLPFSSQPKIISCKVISNTSSMGVVQRHGLINVLPDDAALRIIRKLNGEYLKGKRVGVRQYDGLPEDSSLQLT
jgi:hypothetical protein